MNSKFCTQLLRILGLQKLFANVLFLIIFTAAYSQQTKYFNYAQSWAQVDSFYKQRLSKSALEEVNKIYQQAQKEKFTEQIIKCILVRENLNNTIENDPQRTFSTLKREIDTASFPLKSVLYSVISEEYSKYYESQSYKIDNRTDINTSKDSVVYWGKSGFQQEIMKYLKLSLENKAKLQQIPIELLSELVTKETFYANGNITLYDLLAQRALQILNRQINIAEDIPQWLQNPAIFKSANIFLTLPIKSTDTVSTIYFSLKLFQELLRLHKNDSKPDLFLSYNLERLQYFKEQSLLDNKENLYNQALTQIKNSYPTHPISAEIDYLFATNEYNKNQLQKTIDQCQRTMNRFQNNDKIPGVCECQSMISYIKQSTLNVEHEKVDIPDQPSKIFVSYANVNHLYARIFKLSIDETLQIKEEADTVNDKEVYKLQFAHRKFVKKFDILLPKNNNYQIKSAEILIPSLSPGYYFIWFSDNPEFSPTDILQFVIEQKTNISFVHRTINQTIDQLCVFNRKTGFPLPGATITTYKIHYKHESNRRNFFEDTRDTSFNANSAGLASIPFKYRDFDSYHVDVTSQGDTFSTRLSERLFHSQKDDLESDFHDIFTDRKIYRPGQTIYFKGICYYHKSYKEAVILPFRQVTVTLYGSNSKEIASQTLTTNEFGSYNGSFNAPVNALNGIFHISDSREGHTYFRVEEYKRPKFEVIIDSLSDSYQVGDMIQIGGKALSYSNTVIDKAKVHYIITNYHHTFASKDTVTNNYGEFTLKFKASGNELSKTDDFSGQYTVKVEITDLNGETHQAEKSFLVSNHPFTIKTEIADEIEKNIPGIFNVSAANTSGKSIPATIGITITKLKTPEKAYRERLWNFPDTILIPKAQFLKYFPDLFQKPKEPEKINIVYKTEINTAQTTKVNLNDLENWAAGRYVIDLKATDKSGRTATWSKNFMVYSRKDSLPAIPKIDEFKVLTTTVEVGDTARLLVGSSEHIHALLEVEKDNSIIHQFNIELNNRQRIISFPITGNCVGDVAVHYIFAKDNRTYQHTETIKVPYSAKKLNIRFETFRNKLYPGEKEQWKIRISGPQGEKVAAEMLATLYDASLDAFTPNSFKLDIFGKYNPKLEWNALSGTKGESHSFCRYSYFPVYKSNYLPFVSLSNSFLDNTADPESKISLLSFKSQPTVDIDGRVVDFNGSFLSGVQVVFPGLKASVFSDNQGKFSFKSVVRNTTLTISKPGYQSATMTASGKMGILVKLAKRDSNTKTKWICQDGAVWHVSEKFTAPIVVDEEPVFYCVEEAACFNSGSRVNPDLNKVVPRRNFSETSFFFPNLTTDKNGEIVISFTIPESLTRWKMLGFAHTTDLKTGEIENELVTRKELMVYPNFPRFFREGDTLKLVTRIANLTDTAINGNVKLMLFNAADMKPVDSLLGNPDKFYPFVAKENQSTATGWKLHIPTGLSAIICRIVANSDKFSDGEEVIIPILSNSILVTESVPIFMKGNQNKTFTLNKLTQNKSTTLQNHKLTFEYTSNPAWYAILSLPYLMEFPFECAEQTFSRYYANSLGSFILQSNPKIKSVFDSWKTLPSEQLSDKLEQNQELKSLLIEETPWLRESKNGEARLQQLAKLFDKDNLNKEMERCLAKLSSMQNYDGGLSWFTGMQSSRYITQHVVAGIGHLRKIEGQSVHIETEEPILRHALNYIDQEILNDYNELIRLSDEKKANPDENHLSALILHSLYARSFFIKNYPLSGNYLAAYEYYISQAKKYWADQSVYNQGMIALILKQQDDDLIPATIIASLKERAIVSEEQGMHWQNEQGYFWYQAPVEIQSLLIEAFSEAGGDKTSIEAMKLWLLQQKRTRSWHSTKATTEAVYALLLHGNNWLNVEPDITISVGDEKVLPTLQNKPQPQAGTGYIKTTWEASQISPDKGIVKIKSRSENASWGGLYWQYFEKTEKITRAGSSLSVNKMILKEQHTSMGNMFTQITDTTKLKQGDVLKIRLEIKTELDMEYVHLKDLHAEGLEPEEALSGYHWQGGLAYYQSPRDAATHFFISWMPKGVYILEYSLRITMSGILSNGIATIQCMYAPEFSAHSEGVKIKIE